MCIICGNDNCKVALFGKESFDSIIIRSDEVASKVANSRLYVNADRTKVVAEGSPEAAFLLAGKDGLVSEADVNRYSLSTDQVREANEPSPDEVKARRMAQGGTSNDIASILERLDRLEAAVGKDKLSVAAPEDAQNKARTGANTK